jgi:hypothetical protein
MNIIFQIDGGLGKSVAGTAVCKAIKKKYPDSRLIVVTGYPEVFACNPYVHKTIQAGAQQYFYQDYIEGQKDGLVFAHNPYMDSNFIFGRGHLIQVWCEMFGIPYSGEMPELFMSEIEFNRYSITFGTPKPIMLIQTNGGSVEHGLYSWVRDMPIETAQKVVNAFMNDYSIVHLRTKDQLPLQNATPFQASNFRSLIVLIAMSQKRLFIDSFAQHTAAALTKPSVVTWVGNKPGQFGYAMHANIIASSPTRVPDLRLSMYSPYNIAGQIPSESIYNSQSEIFNPDVIIDTLRNYPNVLETKPPIPNVANEVKTEETPPVAEQKPIEALTVSAEKDETKPKENGQLKKMAKS